MTLMYLWSPNVAVRESLSTDINRMVQMCGWRPGSRGLSIQIPLTSCIQIASDYIMPLPLSVTSYWLLLVGINPLVKVVFSSFSAWVYIATVNLFVCFFYVSLTMHLSITLANDQLDAQILIHLLQSSTCTCFEQYLAHPQEVRLY